MRIQLLVAILCSGLTAGAQAPFLDLDPSTTPASSLPDGFTTSGGHAFFSALDEHGSELWVTDGTASGTRMVLDLYPGARGSSPRQITDFDGAGTVLFVAEHAALGFELWRSDGTAAGTRLVRDIWAGSDSSGPRQLVRVGNRVMFFAATQAAGGELWISDGTAAGTNQVLDIRPGSASSMSASEGMALGSRLLFAADDGLSGHEPWISDGTAAGTVRLADIVPGGGASLAFTQRGNEGFFVAQSSDTQLWRTDGTPVGTVRVATLGPTLRAHIASDGIGVYLTYGSTVWRSDGTPGGTTQLAALPGAAGAIGFAGRMLFSVYVPSTGGELWQTDGTPAGTLPIARFLPPNPFLQLPQRFVALGNRAYFFGDHSLWCTDGTASGTLAVGAMGSDDLAVLGAELLFEGGDGEPWLSGGTVGTTRLLRDLHGPTPSGSYPDLFVQVDDTLYLRARGELWATDGTAAGTRRVVVPPPGTGISDALAWGGRLLFTTSAGLHSTDGVSVTTLRQLTNPHGLVRFAGRVFFADQRDLWSSDGTVAGTQLGWNRNPVTGNASPRWLTAAGDRLFFQATDWTHGQELWISDGTVTGTVLLKDIAPGIFPGLPSAFAALGSSVVFRGIEQASGWELWFSDGTAPGSKMIADIRPGPDGSVPDSLVTVGDHVYFKADDGSHGVELWCTDGTAAGTGLVLDIEPGTVGSQPGALVAAGGRLFFLATTSTSGRELWVSDGTAAGTRMVRDLVPGPGSPDFTPNHLPEPLVAVGDSPLVVFGADDRSGRDAELWLSDGTTAGTRMLDLNPSGAGAPAAFTQIGRTLYFQANDAVIGVEPWRADLAELGASGAFPYGQGCPGTGGLVPQIDAAGAAQIGNRSFGLGLSDGLPGSLSLITLGATRGSLPLGTCTVLYGNPLGTVVAPTSAQGAAFAPIPVPANSALLGLTVFGQGGVFDPQGALAALSLTDGLEILVGR